MTTVIMMPAGDYVCPVCASELHGKSAQQWYCNGVATISREPTVGQRHDPVAFVPVTEADGQ